MVCFLGIIGGSSLWRNAGVPVGLGLIGAL